MTKLPARKYRRGAIAWMAGNSVASNLLMLFFLVGGLLFALQIKQEFFPDFDEDMVQITIAYPGASPEEVEKGIVLAVEEAVRGIDGVDDVTASATEGSASVTVELLRDVDNNKVCQDIQQEVDRITSFPEEAEEPTVTLVSRKRQVLSVIVYGDVSEKVLRDFTEAARERMLQKKDITQIELSAVRDLEISVEIPQAKLREYNMTLADVASKISSTSVEIPGGGLKTRGGEILVRMKERRDYGREFAQIPIVNNDDGTQVLLSDIARVVDGFEDTDYFASFDGKPAMGLDIYRVGDQTPIEVSDAARECMAELEADLPPGVHFAVRRDMSEVYRQRMDLLLRNARLGLILVFVLLGLFLEARLAFWVTMGIPVSFLGAFLFLPGADISINMISMFAFIVALGIVVDDAIVVGENVYEYHQRGLPFLEAAMRGAREVAMPVVFSILTNVAAFLPLLFIPGIMGKIMRTIPSVVIIVFLISLVESLLILPAHLGHGDGKRGKYGAWLHVHQQRFSHWFSAKIRDIYGPFLDRMLKMRYMTIAVGVAVLLCVVAFIASGRMGTELMPKVESDFAVAKATLPYGSSVERTTEVRDKILAAAKRVAERHGGEKDVEGIYAFIGNGGSHVCDIYVFLADADVRTIGTGPFVDEWRKEAGDIPGLENIYFRSDHGGPGSGAAITIELSHENLQLLEKAGEELAEALSRFPNVKDIDDGFAPGKRQYDFTLLPTGRSLGLTSYSVARQVRNSFYGAEALRQQRGRNEVKVMVRLPKDERIHAHDLEELLIRTPSGKEIPLREAVTVKRGRAYTSIDRREGRRIITVTADVIPQSQADMVLNTIKADTLPKLLEKYHGLSYGFEGKQADIKESLQSLVTGFVIAMLAVYALLAIPFGSYIQPLIIMVSIPFGIVGAVLGHLLMGYEALSIMSMMGIVALAGVVVNDSLVLIDFANREYKQGRSAHDAVHAAGIRRFRPIMLTTLTTFGGLAPMIFETSMQARFLIPMALSLGYGILFATLISLLLVPCLFLVVEDVRRIFGWNER